MNGDRQSEWPNPEAFALAKKRANDLFPVPHEIPLEAGIKSAVVAGLIIACFVTVNEVASSEIAGWLTVVFAGAVAYGDCRIRWRRNAEEVAYLYEFHKKDPRPSE